MKKYLLILILCVGCSNSKDKEHPESDHFQMPLTSTVMLDVSRQPSENYITLLSGNLNIRIQESDGSFYLLIEKDASTELRIVSEVKNLRGEVIRTFDGDGDGIPERRMITNEDKIINAENLVFSSDNVDLSLQHQSE